MGYIKQAHGIRGEVFAVIPSGEWEWAQKGAQIYLKPRDSKADWSEKSIATFRPHKTGLIIQFKDVPDRNHAELLKGYSLGVAVENFVSRPGEKIYLNEVMGFQVFSGEQLIGEVIGFMDNGAQDLLRVRDEIESEKEHLIPFLEVFIDSIEFEGAKIFMTLPEGLIE